MRTPSVAARARSGRHAAAGAPPAVLELSAVPSLGPLYARGVAGSALAAARPGGAVRPEDLRPDALLVRGVQADAAHLTAYQHLLGEPASDRLPAGFVHVLAFPVATALMVRSVFPLPLLGMVHTRNRVEQRRPVVLGEALDLRVHAERLQAHHAGVTVDIVAEASVDDEVVWSGRSTYLAKGVRWAGDPRPSGAEGTAAPEKEGFVPPVPTGQWRLSPDVGRAYAAVSGDRNPIHLSALAAKAFGFRRTIAHGMYTAARALADVGPERGDAFVWDVTFAKPVLLPSTVTMRVGPDRTAGSVPPGTRQTVGFAGWDQKRGTKHFSGTVAPLG